MRFLFLLIPVYIPFIGFPQIFIEKPEFQKYFKEYDVQGSFVLYDLGKNQYTCYNKQQLDSGFVPASTFKIFNSLVGIETGVIHDENYVIKWDSVKRSYDSWNKDHDLKSAYKNSAYWYYQELARKVGEEKMKFYITKANYGNLDISGGLDQFWLKGKLRITPLQQIEMLRKLYCNELPFSERTFSIVKKIMIEEDTLGYVLRAKTGWGDDKLADIGWYIGYIEKESKVYFFTICVQSKNLINPDFAKCRKLITRKTLANLEVIPKI
jgi:beta-lactamase class D